MTVKVKQGEMKQHYPLEEDQAKEGEEEYVELLQEGHDHGPL